MDPGVPRHFALSAATRRTWLVPGRSGSVLQHRRDGGRGLLGRSGRLLRRRRSLLRRGLLSSRRRLLRSRLLAPRSSLRGPSSPWSPSCGGLARRLLGREPVLGRPPSAAAASAGAGASAGRGTTMTAVSADDGGRGGLAHGTSPRTGRCRTLGRHGRLGRSGSRLGLRNRLGDDRHHGLGHGLGRRLRRTGRSRHLAGGAATGTALGAASPGRDRHSATGASATGGSTTGAGHHRILDRDGLGVSDGAGTTEPRRPRTRPTGLGAASVARRASALGAPAGAEARRLARRRDGHRGLPRPRPRRRCCTAPRRGANAGSDSATGAATSAATSASVSSPRGLARPRSSGLVLVVLLAPAPRPPRRLRLPPPPTGRSAAPCAR